MGYSVDKVEFILMGGIFMLLLVDYCDYFIRNLYDVLFGYIFVNVEEVVVYFEYSVVKCIGMIIEMWVIF